MEKQSFKQFCKSLGLVALLQGTTSDAVSQVMKNPYPENHKINCISVDPLETHSQRDTYVHTRDAQDMSSRLAERLEQREEPLQIRALGLLIDPKRESRSHEQQENIKHNIRLAVAVVKEAKGFKQLDNDYLDPEEELRGSDIAINHEEPFVFEEIMIADQSVLDIRTTTNDHNLTAALEDRINIRDVVGAEIANMLTNEDNAVVQQIREKRKEHNSKALMWFYEGDRGDGSPIYGGSGQSMCLRSIYQSYDGYKKHYSFSGMVAFFDQLADHAYSLEEIKNEASNYNPVTNLSALFTHEVMGHLLNNAGHQTNAGGCDPAEHKHASESEVLLNDGGIYSHVTSGTHSGIPVIARTLKQGMQPHNATNDKYKGPLSQMIVNEDGTLEPQMIRVKFEHVGTQYDKYVPLGGEMTNNHDMSEQIPLSAEMRFALYTMFNEDFTGEQTTSLEETPDISSSITLYPNPAQDLVTIDYPEYDTKYIFLADMNGRVLKMGAFTNNQIDISDLPNGVYTVQLRTNDNKVATKKLVIAK